MAAWLAYLKSRLLLPRTKADEAEDPSDLAAALAERLRRLEIIRAAGQALEARPRVGRDLMLRGMPDPTILNGDGDDGAPVWTATIYDLLSAYTRQRQKQAATRVSLRRRVVWSLSEARSALQRLVGEAADWTALDAYLIEYCVTPELRRTVRASSFSAMLEMVKEGKLSLRQGRPFRPAVGQAPLSGRPGRGRLMAEIARLFPDVEQPREARQLAEGKRIAEAMLFAADRAARRGQDRRAPAGRPRRAADVLAALRQDYADRGVPPRAGRRPNGCSAPPTTSPGYCRQAGARYASCRGRRSRRWRSSPTISRRPAPRSRTSAASPSPKARSMCFSRRAG